MGGILKILVKAFRPSTVIVSHPLTAVLIFNKAKECFRVDQAAQHMLNLICCCVMCNLYGTECSIPLLPVTLCVHINLYK